MTNKYLATVSEVKAVLTSYMRLTHGLTLEVDDEKLVRLLTSVREGTHTEVLADDDIRSVEILEVSGKRVSVKIPKGYPVVLNEGPRRVYVAVTPIGRVQIAKRDLENMALSLDVVKDVGVGKKMADSLEVGIIAAPVAPPDTPVTPPPPEKPAKPTREERRLADHNAHVCTCQRPPMHPCPSVREFGATILPLEVVLEKIAAEKAS